MMTPSQQETTMFGLSKIALAAFALAMIVGTGPSYAQQTAPAATAANPGDCFTDDGYGRKRPCSAGLTKNTIENSTNEPCFTDEGNGRKRACNAAVKPK
jgi:hypothetical protein